MDSYLTYIRPMLLGAIEAGVLSNKALGLGQEIVWTDYDSKAQMEMIYIDKGAFGSVWKV